MGQFFYHDNINSYHTSIVFSKQDDWHGLTLHQSLDPLGKIVDVTTFYIQFKTVHDTF